MAPLASFSRRLKAMRRAVGDWLRRARQRRRRPAGPDDAPPHLPIPLAVAESPSAAALFPAEPLFWPVDLPRETYADGDAAALIPVDSLWAGALTSLVGAVPHAEDCSDGDDETAHGGDEAAPSDTEGAEEEDVWSMGPYHAPDESRPRNSTASSSDTRGEEACESDNAQQQDQEGEAAGPLDAALRVTKSAVHFTNDAGRRLVPTFTTVWSRKEAKDVERMVEWSEELRRALDF
ncbi:hypothetical protein DFJ74DRAFT_667999 [Hyaloraphidium curvatum]|nr:hypothetical protein DFJ74DRAFT_667999 [Hyaloraphidium curvatum]